MVRLSERMQHEKDRLEMAQKLGFLLDQAGAILFDRGIVNTEVYLRQGKDVHASYRAFGHGLLRVQAYPGFSTEEQAHLAARNTFGDEGLIEADLPFSPESVAEFVVERFEPVTVS